MDKKIQFDFTALPKCMVTDRPTSAEIEVASATGRMLFVILTCPIPEAKKIDLFMDGFLAGSGVPRSEYMAIFFNDTGLSQEEAQEKFMEKYKSMKFPESISGYTTLATKKKPNRLSEFLKIAAITSSDTHAPHIEEKK